MPVITDNAYVVMTPAANFSMQNGMQGIMYFKTGTHSIWDGSKSDYLRCNPNFWYRSFRIRWTGTNQAGQAGDIYGLDGSKQILTNMFASTRQNAAQNSYAKVYPNANTEWWYTTDANCIAALHNLQNGWDQQWQVGQQTPNLDPNNQAQFNGQPLVLGTVQVAQGDGAQINGLPPSATVGPEFDRRFGAVSFFRNLVGTPSNSL